MIFTSNGNCLSLIFPKSSRWSSKTFESVCPLNSPSLILLSPFGCAEGDGIFVQMLKEKGIAVYSENEVTEVLKLINGGK